MRTHLLVLALLASTGCTHKVVIRFPHVQPGPPQDRHKTWVNGFLWNLVGGETDVSRFCGHRPVAMVETKRSFGNSIVSWLTFGIYTPMWARITCGVAAAPLPAPYPPGTYQPPPQQAPMYMQPSPPAYVPPPAP
jgi:hypothetical protein